MEYQRIEVITGTPRRRRYTAEQKAAAVMESMAPDASIADIARRHGICRSLLFRSRQLAQASAAPCQPGPRAGPAFVPVMLEAPVAAATAAVDCAASCSTMEIVLVDGRSLRFDASVDAAALGRVLKALAAA